ncbi:hypothetical protein CTAYLR_008176 [Chrysophaeum taylorii]|uniref:DM10 domain-containing protein n=1 Tax=Chrysophaeum taylorii TaxID=2483200 RepID=A0AAD7U957_9STRA|nr:hypothetical protein CTAYLR_008176 [Chrysophaeum taylorii]
MKDAAPPQVLAYSVEHLDASGVVRQFRLNSFSDGTLELVDSRHRMFLKRVYCPHITRDALYEGSVVNVFGRAFEILGPADPGTTKYVERTSTAAAAVRLDSQALGEMVRRLERAVTAIRSLATVRLVDLPADAHERLKEVPGNLVVSICVYDATTAAGAKLDDALRDIVSVPLDPTLDLHTLAHCCDPLTLCLVKPHVLKAKRGGDLLLAIARAGFEVAALHLFFLDATSAHAFFTAYKGVWREYEDIVAHCTQGPCLALMLQADPAPFRDFCGPLDVELAKALRPTSLRATFGDTLVENAVHCTDMSEDGQLECHFFFNLLAKAGA